MELLNDYHVQWTILLSFCFVLFLVNFVQPKFGAIPTIFFSYIGASSLYVWCFHRNRYFSVQPYDQQALKYYAGGALLTGLLILAPLMLLSGRNKTHFFIYGRSFAGMFLWINGLSIVLKSIFFGCAGVNSCGGVVGNPSISAGLLVTMLPLFFRNAKKDWPNLVIVALSVFVSKSSIALGLLMVFLAIHFCIEKRMFFLGLWAAGASFIGGFFMFGKGELFNSSNRFKVWAYMMDYWDAWWNIPMGTGLGTYKVFSLTLQEDKNLDPNAWWSTLHNEWLQVVFELGVLGIILALAVYAIALRRSLFNGHKAIFYSLILYGLYMGVNAAFHHAAPAIFGAWLFVHALQLESETS